MIKDRIDLSNKIDLDLSNKQERYLITPSLLNSYLYIYESMNNVTEAENDKISLEDKQAVAYDEHYKEFLKTLSREPQEPNVYMQMGIEFEKQSYEGHTIVSPIIKGGLYQLVGKKNITVDGMDFLMYGRLDVLKGGTIYDIKKVMKYNVGKYRWSSQHRFYLDLFTRADKFVYLAVDNQDRLHKEMYFRDECISTEEQIRKFVNFLNENNLMEEYKKKWKSKF